MFGERWDAFMFCIMEFLRVCIWDWLLRLSFNQITSNGDSASWQNSKSNFARIWVLFVASNYASELQALDVEARKKVEDLPESIKRNTKLWEQFATYLFEGYTIAEGRKNAARHLAASSVEDNLNHQLRAAGSKFVQVG